VPPWIRALATINGGARRILNAECRKRVHVLLPRPLNPDYPLNPNGGK